MMAWPGIEWLLAAGKAQAQQPMPHSVRIAHLSHGQGPLAEMASYALMGAQLGTEEANITAGMFGTKVELLSAAGVTATNVVAVAEKLLAQPDLAAIVGALDDPTTTLLSDFAQQRRVVFLNAAARGDALRGAKCHRYTFHVEADLAMYVHAVGQWLLRNNRKRWYFVVTGDPLAQEIYRRASRLLQAGGGAELGRFDSAPGQHDYQAMLTGLAALQAEAIFVALMGQDLLQFLRQHKAIGAPTLVAGAPLDILAMWQAGPEHLHGVWATSWYHQLERFSARELNRRFTARFGKPAEGYAWANWAAVKMLVEGVLRSASTEPVALVKYLGGSPPFDGHKGKALTFRDWNQQLRQPLYIVKAREAPPQNPWDLLELVDEVPAPATRGKPVWEILDTLGEARTESACRLEQL
jgi:ABC-type branched-subunit amino acid transport system substrate-binding protein